MAIELFRRTWLICLLIGCGLFSQQTHAQPEPAASDDYSRGLDLVILVDDSSSMFTDPNSKSKGNDKGSDPAKMRWDAVQLTVDLLTPSDHVAILPFEKETPSLRFKREAKGLQELDNEKKRTDVGEHISKFAAATDDYEKNLRPNGRSTAIFVALEAARKLFPPGAQQRRREAIILLTDGGEQEDEQIQKIFDVKISSDEDLIRQNVNIMQIVNGRLEKYGVPVYVFRLAPEGVSNADKTQLKKDMNLLNAIAKSTHGGYEQVENTEQLVETFRKTIWSLNAHWIETIELKPRASHTVPDRPIKLNGLIDLGMLCYEVDNARWGPQPRITFPPDPAPKQLLENNGKKLELKVAGRTAIVPANVPGLKDHKSKPTGQPTGYSYFYFDQMNTPAEGFASKPKAGAGAFLAFDFNASNYERRVFLSRRAVRPVLELERETYYRHEPISIRVIMPYDGTFEPESFTARAWFDKSSIKVTLAGERGKDRSGKDVLIFFGSVSASDLPVQIARGIDKENLKIEFVGEEKPQHHALSGSRYELPLRTLGIDNAVPLVAPELVELSPLNVHQRIVLRPKFDLPRQEELQLAVKFAPPKWKGGSFDAKKAFTTSPVGDAIMRDNQLDLSISFDNTSHAFGNDPLEGGAITVDGQIKSKYRIVRYVPWPEREKISEQSPVRISIRAETKKLSLPKYETISLRVRAGGASDSKSVSLIPSDPKAANVGEIKLKLTKTTLPSAGLWLQAAGTKEALGKDRRRQELSITNLGEPIEIWFEPGVEQATAIVGKEGHAELEVSGKAIDQSKTSISLVVDPPEIELRKTTQEITAYTGNKSLPVEVEARLKWIPGGSQTYSIKPAKDGKPATDKTLEFNGSEKQGKPRSIPVVLPKAIELAAPQIAIPDAWQTIKFALDLDLNPSIGPGKYKSQIELVHSNPGFPKKVVDLELRVNALELSLSVNNAAAVAAFGGNDLNRELKQDEPLIVTQFFDRPTECTIVIRNPAETEMDARQVTVEFEKDASRKSGIDLLRAKGEGPGEPVDYVKSPEIVGPKEGKSKLILVTLKFPPIRNAFPDRVYEGELVFTFSAAHRGSGNGAFAKEGKRRLPLRVIFIESQDILYRKS